MNASSTSDMATHSVIPTACERPAKRLKLSVKDELDDPSKEVQWADIEGILATAEGDGMEKGWISGDVFMVFRSKTKREAQLISNHGSGMIQLRLSVSCPDYQRFQFAVGQSLRVSLRGARVVRSRTGTSVPGYMPFHLLFQDGAAVKFVMGMKTVESGTIVDSWLEETGGDGSEVSSNWFLSAPAQTSDARYNSPTREDSAPASSSAHSSPFPKTPERDLGSARPESSVTISNGGDRDEDLAMDIDVQDLNQNIYSYAEGKASIRTESTDDSNDGPTPPPERREKKTRKRDTRHDHLREALMESGSNPQGSGPIKGSKLSKKEKRMLQRELARRAEQATPELPKRSPALDLVAGISTETAAYPSLEAIRANSFVHVMGVVGDIGTPSATRRNDVCLTVTLVDPSRFQDGASFKVTLFMKTSFEHMLPSSASKGHALLLRDVRASEWRAGSYANINGTVYPEKVKWVGYNPDTGKLYYPELAHEAAQGSQPALNAFYQPKQSEIRYLVQLGDWWRAIKEEEQRGAIQIADYARRQREHRLIGNCEANDFFNATVEILKLEEAESGQTTLFFTDYTPHLLRSTEGFYGQCAMHASTGMIDSYLLDIMKTGTYWSISNMRLKIGSTGALEADLYGARMYEVDEEDRYLAELLKRKEAYLKEHPQNPSEGDVSECTISDISGTGHYNIVAELLYRTRTPDTVTDLFVTDYTDNSHLTCFMPEALKQRLNGSQATVLQISAWDSHEFVRDMEIGSVYSFSDVRIKEYHDGGLRGNLKLADKRITRMSVKRTENSAVLTLLKRKSDLATSESLNHRDTPMLKNSREPRAPVATSDAIRSRHTDQPKSTIREIKSTQKFPNKFRLIARIVNFYPMDVSDFTVRWCSSCDSRISENHNACVKCEDSMGEHVTWVFHFFLVLEDEEGETLLTDVRPEAKFLLPNLQPCDLKGNHDALTAVKRRLQQCLGNLVEVHERIKEGELVEVQYGPYFDLAVKSWAVLDGDSETILFSLTGCETVEQP